ncbi:MAG TPA: hypothetical protein VJZ00_05905 [Thermoanaerobaculia bacterium]|nr:hypothetical protein [Thermoanaerobaculia bacterium]
MKNLRAKLCVCTLLAAAQVSAQTPKTIRAFLPVVTRVQGATAFFYTSLDVTNHSALSKAEVKYAFVSADNQIRRDGVLATLDPLRTFHADDFMQWLADHGALTAAQAANVFGTLTLTASDVNFALGTEVSAVARVWNYANGSSGATVGLAYRSTPLVSGRSDQLISITRDTTRSGSGPVLVTNLGIANTGFTSSLSTATNPAEVRLSFYDAVSGAAIGGDHTYSLAPGQVIQISDIFRQFSLPTGSDVIARVDGPPQDSPKLAGYVVLKDAVNNDGSYFEMTPAPPPPAIAGNAYDGAWEGQTPGGSTIAFTVERNSITSITMPFSVATPGGTCRGTTTMKPAPPIPITTRGFFVNYSASGHSTTLNGTLTSTSEASVVWGSDSYGGIFCGYLVIGGSFGNVTLTVRKK